MCIRSCGVVRVRRHTVVFGPAGDQFRFGDTALGEPGTYDLRRLEVQMAGAGCGFTSPVIPMPPRSTRCCCLCHALIPDTRRLIRGSI